MQIQRLASNRAEKGYTVFKYEIRQRTDRVKQEETTMLRLFHCCVKPNKVSIIIEKDCRNTRKNRINLNMTRMQSWSLTILESSSSKFTMSEVIDTHNQCPQNKEVEMEAPNLAVFIYTIIVSPWTEVVLQSKTAFFTVELQF